ncbi:MAG TPA: hypothetical protein VFF73_22750 [Planctomycetota bacterium]|nr:hypothetical protein [Planctomycetota bacterium]
MRCAYCHDDLGEGRACPSCATRLHDECWLLAGPCPTLGCRRRLRILVERVGASVWHLAWWLAVFIAVWSTLVGVIPSFETMFQETGFLLPEATETLMGASRVARSPIGIWAAVLVTIASIAVFRRWRSSPTLRRALVGLTISSLAFFPFAALALFLPTVQICTKL